ncbi:hypothetical protein ACLOJK_018809, partial [Asimina triloba]
VHGKECPSRLVRKRLEEDATAENMTPRRRYGDQRGHGGMSRALGQHLPRHGSHNQRAFQTAIQISTKLSAAPPFTPDQAFNILVLPRIVSKAPFRILSAQIRIPDHPLGLLTPSIRTPDRL